MANKDPKINKFENMRFKKPSWKERLTGALKSAWTKSTGRPPPSLHGRFSEREGSGTTTRSTQANMKASKGLSVLGGALALAVVGLTGKVAFDYIDENILDKLKNTEQSTTPPSNE